jgi:hypothetical protein
VQVYTPLFNRTICFSSNAVYDKNAILSLVCALGPKSPALAGVDVQCVQFRRIMVVASDRRNSSLSETDFHARFDFGALFFSGYFSSGQAEEKYPNMFLPSINCPSRYLLAAISLILSLYDKPHNYSSHRSKTEYRSIRTGDDGIGYAQEQGDEQTDQPAGERKRRVGNKKSDGKPVQKSTCHCKIPLWQIHEHHWDDIKDAERETCDETHFPSCHGMLLVW